MTKFAQIIGEHALKTPDFMLVGNNVQLSHRAYYARFVHPVLRHRCILWSGYINLAKPQITMHGESAFMYVFAWIEMFNFHTPPQHALQVMFNSPTRPGLQHIGSGSSSSGWLRRGWLRRVDGSTQAQPLGEPAAGSLL